jgi:molybdate transport system regulatory protein
MKVGYKIWLDIGHGMSFGEGHYELLTRAKKTKSLNQAAGQMGMSYAKALRLLHTVEKELGISLFERSIGGRGGGGSRVTAEGNDLVKGYGALLAAAKKTLPRVSREYFRSMKSPSMKSQKTL